MCRAWISCPHTSWRWMDDVHVRKQCNWCGHQWNDPEKTPAEPVTPAESACAHVAWRWVSAAMQRKVCDDCYETFYDTDALVRRAVEANLSALDKLAEQEQRDQALGKRLNDALDAADELNDAALVMDRDQGDKPYRFTVEECTKTQEDHPATEDCGTDWRGRDIRRCMDCGYTFTEERIAWDPTDGPDDTLRNAIQELSSPMLLAIDYAHGGVTDTLLTLPGANVVAEDGVLKVSHHGPVHAIVAVRPMYINIAGGEPSESEPEGDEG